MQSSSVIRSTFQRIIKGTDVDSVFLKGSFRSFSVKIIALFIGFVLQVVVARSLGVHHFGVYAYCFAWINLFSFVAIFGFNRVILRFLPVYLQNKEYGLSFGLLKRSLAIVAAASLFICVSFYIFITINLVHAKEEIIATMSVAILLLPMLGLSALYEAGLYSTKQVFRAQFANKCLRPIIIILTIVIFFYYLGLSLSAKDAMWIQVGATGVSLIIGFKWLLNALPHDVWIAEAGYRDRDWFGMALPMLVVAGIQTILNQTDVVMLGILSGTSSSGIYNVMVRLSDFTLFGLAVVNSIAAPMISELYSSGKHSELQRVVKLAAKGSTIFMVAASLFLVLFARPILSIYGDGFEVGLTALYILLMAHAILAVTGPVGYVVAMTGHQVKLAQVQAVSAVLNVLLNYILIPRFGLTGAAIASSISITMVNIWLLIFVRKRLNIITTPF